MKRREFLGVLVSAFAAKKIAATVPTAPWPEIPPRYLRGLAFNKEVWQLQSEYNAAMTNAIMCGFGELRIIRTYDPVTLSARLDVMAGWPAPTSESATFST